MYLHEVRSHIAWKLLDDMKTILPPLTISCTEFTSLSFLTAFSFFSSFPSFFFLFCECIPLLYFSASGISSLFAGSDSNATVALEAMQ